MADWLFPPPEPKGLPVLGRTALYPVARIFCVGRNYEAHAAEMGHQVDREAPFYFTKSAAHLVPSGATVPYPSGTTDYHHEVELVVALGAPLDHASPETAARAVYACATGLDMTRRDLQIRERTKQRPWDLGKDVEDSAVVGPLRRGFEPGAQRIHLAVNGTMRQDASLAELVWSVPDILAHLSSYYRLGPGDLVMTGTPAGVGPVVAGDRIEGGIDGLAPVTLTLR